MSATDFHVSTLDELADVFSRLPAKDFMKFCGRIRSSHISDYAQFGYVQDWIVEKQKEPKAP